jgi:signal transduction histidine kinase
MMVEGEGSVSIPKGSVRIPSEFLVQIVLAELGVAIAFADDDLQILDHTAEFGIYSREPEASLIGRRLPDLFPELIGCEEDLSAVASGRVAIFELPKINRVAPDSQGMRYVSLIALPVPEVRDCLILLARDTTLEARLEQRVMQQLNELRLLRAELEAANAELVRLNEEKSVFLRMAAHDLRAPLAVVKAYVDMVLAREGDLPADKLDHYLRTVQARTEGMTRLVGNLLDVEKIESGEVVFDREAVDLAQLLAEVVGSFEPLAQQSDLMLQCQLPPSLPHPIADRDRLVQVLNNLVSNALKFTPAGGQVRVEAFGRGGEVLVEVSDTGPGISAEDQAWLFRRFFRSDNARQQQILGTGLGLSIVRAIVEQHGGRVHVRSQLGQGSTFGFSLPVEEG